MNDSLSSPLPAEKRTSVLLGLRLHSGERAKHSSAGSFAEVSAARISGHGGSLFEISGSLLLAEFKDAAAAVNCAIDVQERFRPKGGVNPDDEPVRTSIGIHYGELYLSDGVCQGSGVELLKELLEFVRGSSIYITQDVFVRVRLLLPLKFENVGKKKFSGFGGEKDIFSVGWESVTENLKASLRRLDQDDLQRATRLSSKLGIDASKKGSSIVLIFFLLFLFVLLKFLKLL